MTDYAAFSTRDGERIAESVRAHEAGLNGRHIEKRPKPPRDYVAQRFRNDSGETAPAYGVLRVTGTYDDDGVIIYTIGKPDTSFARLYLVNGPNDVADDGFGWGTWLWHADWVLYDDGNTPAYGEEWGPSNASWKVAKNRPGFYIWGGATGGTRDIVKASQKFAETVLGKADAAIDNATSGTVRVYIGTPGSETDSGLTISSAYNKGPDIADEAWVTVSWPHGKPYVWLANCP